MTFPLVCYCHAMPRPVAAVFKLLHAVALAFVLILCFLGLYEFPYTPEDTAPLINGRQRAPRNAPKPETLKQRLPPVEYMELITLASETKTTTRLPIPPREEDGEASSSSSSSSSGAGAVEPTCRVCLERLEARDEVRRLGNCAHAFHTACIDRWIDMGEVTCPLCRAQLLPRRRAGLLGRARIGY